jgi:hypothetical protein
MNCNGFPGLSLFFKKRFYYNILSNILWMVLFFERRAMYITFNMQGAYKLAKNQNIEKVSKDPIFCSYNGQQQVQAQQQNEVSREQLCIQYYRLVGIQTPCS